MFQIIKFLYLMIESNIIKRFIVKTFMHHSRIGIEEIAEKIMASLKCIFINKNTQQPGKIVKCQKDSYRVLLGNAEEIDVMQSEISRKSQVKFEDVLMFLECSKKSTPFGRILIENVFEKLSDPGFGVVYIPQNDNTKRPERTAAQKSAVQRQIKELTPANSVPNEEQKVVKKQNSRFKYPTINLKEIEKFKIEKYSEEDLKKLVKIYSFLSSFPNELGVKTHNSRMGPIV